MGVWILLGYFSVLIFQTIQFQKRKSDQTAIGPTEESSPKKVKANLPSSGEGVAENATISIEYAKSGRSTCKVCSEGIAKGALRLGATARDPRGYDSTKWYHVACFPTSSHPLDPVEEIQGFDSIKVWALVLLPQMSVY